MPRVVFVIDSLFALGPFWQLKILLQELGTHNNLDLHVVSLNGESGNADFVSELATHHGLSLNHRPFNRFVELRNQIVELSPDIVHAWGDQVHSITKWATAGISCRRLFSHFEKEEQSFLPSPWSRTSDKHVYSHRSLPNDNGPESHVIGNRLQDATIERESSRTRLMKLIGIQNDNVFLAGTVAYHRPKFRLKDLVWAIDLLCCVRQDIHLIIFAEGDSKALVRFVGKTEAGRNIHLVAPELARTTDIHGLDFYWHSHLQVPNPLPMVSAMNCGVPVISVLDDETSDLVLPLQSALATNFGARDEFARWTKYLIEQHESAQQLKSQARRHVEKLFTNSQMVQDYLELYCK